MKASRSPAQKTLRTQRTATPTSLRYSSRPLTFSCLKGAAEDSSVSTDVASASQGASCSTFGRQSSPAGSFDVEASNTSQGERPLLHLYGTTPTTADSPVDDDDVDVAEMGNEEGSTVSHADSFYASLLVAQKLRRQKEATTATAARCASTASTGYCFSSSTCDTQQSVSANFGPLSARSPTTNVASSFMGVSPTSQSSSQPPRTLHDLLAWRQELIETRLKDQGQRHKHQQQQQQQQRQDSTDFSWSVSSHSSSRMSEAPLRPARCTLLAPETVSPPVLSLSCSQPSLQFPSVHTPVAPKERTLTPNLVARQTNTPCTASRSHIDVPAQSPSHAGWTAALSHPQQHQQPSPLPLVQRTASRPSSSSTAASSPLPSRTTSHVLETREKSAHQEELSEYIRLHDEDVGQSMMGRFGLLLMLAVVLLILVDAPFLPGGSWGGLF